MAQVIRHPDGRIEVNMDKEEWAIFNRERLKILVHMKKVILEEARAEMRRTKAAPDPAGIPNLGQHIATKVIDTFFGVLFDNAPRGYDNSDDPYEGYYQDAGEVQIEDPPGSGRYRRVSP